MKISRETAQAAVEGITPADMDEYYAATGYVTDDEPMTIGRVAAFLALGERLRGRVLGAMVDLSEFASTITADEAFAALDRARGAVPVRVEREQAGPRARSSGRDLAGNQGEERDDERLLSEGALAFGDLPIQPRRTEAVKRGIEIPDAESLAVRRQTANIFRFAEYGGLSDRRAFTGIGEVPEHLREQAKAAAGRRWWDYKHISAWGLLMGCSEQHIGSLMRRACAEGAPLDAIYRDAEGTWVRWSDYAVADSNDPTAEAFTASGQNMLRRVPCNDERPRWYDHKHIAAWGLLTGAAPELVREWQDLAARQHMPLDAVPSHLNKDQATWIYNAQLMLTIIPRTAHCRSFVQDQEQGNDPSQLDLPIAPVAKSPAAGDSAGNPPGETPGPHSEDSMHKTPVPQKTDLGGSAPAPHVTHEGNTTTAPVAPVAKSPGAVETGPTAPVSRDGDRGNGSGAEEARAAGMTDSKTPR